MDVYTQNRVHAQYIYLQHNSVYHRCTQRVLMKYSLILNRFTSPVLPRAYKIVWIDERHCQITKSCLENAEICWAVWKGLRPTKLPGNGTVQPPDWLQSVHSTPGPQLSWAIIHAGMDSGDGVDVEYLPSWKYPLTHILSVVTPIKCFNNMVRLGGILTSSCHKFPLWVESMFPHE